MIVCDECGDEFEPHKSARRTYLPTRFCSKRCRQRQWVRAKYDKDRVAYYTHLLAHRRRQALARRSVGAQAPSG